VRIGSMLACRYECPDGAREPRETVSMAPFRTLSSVCAAAPVWLELPAREVTSGGTGAPSEIKAGELSSQEASDHG